MGSRGMDTTRGVDCPGRWTVRVTAVPWGPRIRLDTWSAVMPSVLAPSMARMRSNGRSPARCAGLLGNTNRA